MIRGKKSQMLEIQVKRSHIIFTVTPLDFAARSVASLSLPVCPTSEVFNDLGLSAQVSPHTL